jgi:hypothetical protein
MASARAPHMTRARETEAMVPGHAHFHHHHHRCSIAYADESVYRCGPI